MLATRFFSEVWNPPSRMESIDELLSEDFAVTTDGEDLRGRETFRKWVLGLQSKVDDLKVEPQEMLVTDDGKRVITRLLTTGRNNGMFGTRPDGAPVKLVVISILEIEDGKIVRNWAERSALELHQRLTSQQKQRQASQGVTDQNTAPSEVIFE